MVKKVCPVLDPRYYGGMVSAIHRNAQTAPGNRLRIALFFDCDNTIVNDTTSDFIAFIGEDPTTFWTKMAERWHSGWIGSTSFLYGMLEVSKHRKIQRQDFIDFGKSVSFFDGVHDLFNRLRAFAHEVCPAIQLEFYLVSGSIGDILRAMPIAHEFNEIFACEWHYGENEEIVFPRRTMNAVEKTTAFNVIARGLSSSEYVANQFRAEHRSVEFSVPFSQMAMIGDSEGDIPAMYLVLEGGGRAIGVHHPNREPDLVLAREISRHSCAHGPFLADYTAGTEIESALKHAIFTCALPGFLRQVVLTTLN